MERMDVRLPKPLHDALRRAAEADATSMQTIARIAICRFLTVKKRQAEQVPAS
jgi:hypothetical protein